MNFKHSIACFITITCIIITSCGRPDTDSIDLNIEFAKEIKKTSEFLDDNKWIIDSLSTFDIDPQLAITTIYPELLFYAAGADKAEIIGLKLLYVPFGESVADFSIGTFQMKPSFVRKVESYWCEYFGAEYLNKQGITLEDTKQQRKARIERLSDFEWSIRYLGMFIKILEQKYPDSQYLTPRERAEFFATAYNSSFTVPFEDILKRSNWKLFKTAVFPITTNKVYRYSRFSLLYVDLIK